MPTKTEWVNIIHGRGGKESGDFQGNHGYSLVPSSYAAQYELIDASWFYRERGDQNKKPVRDVTAREMRKDGWEVKTETNTLGYFLHAKRRKK
jgi:hypothetical protein